MMFDGNDEAQFHYRQSTEQFDLVITLILAAQCCQLLQRYVWRLWLDLCHQAEDECLQKRFAYIEVVEHLQGFLRRRELDQFLNFLVPFIRESPVEAVFDAIEMAALECEGLRLEQREAVNAIRIGFQLLAAGYAQELLEERRILLKFLGTGKQENLSANRFS